MGPHRRIGLPLLFFALVSPWNPAFGGDSAAEAALKAKGLVRAGRVFVDTEAEKPVLAKMKEVRADYADYATVAEKQAMAESLPMQAAQLEDQRVALKSNIDLLNQQISVQTASQGSGKYARAARAMGPTPLEIQRQQVTATMNEVAATQKAVKAQTPAAKDKAAIDDEVKKKGEVLKTALADLRTVVDEVKAKYVTLNADESSKKSLVELEKIGKAKLSIGPSEAFNAGSKELDQAERRLLGKKPVAPASSKKKSMTKSKK